jgi:hypothetical protein
VQLSLKNSEKLRKPLDIGRHPAQNNKMLAARLASYNLLSLVPETHF